MVDVPPDIFDEDGNLITPDQSWMDQKFIPPTEPQIVEIPSWVTNNPKAHDYGMWKHLGYSAAYDGPGTEIRRKALIEIYTATFIPKRHTDIEYLDEFGEPMSEQRFSKIMGYISAQINSKENLTQMEGAVKKWVGDRDWFIQYIDRDNSDDDDKI